MTDVTFEFDVTTVEIETSGQVVEMVIDTAPVFTVEAAIGLTRTVFQGGSGISADPGNNLTLGGDGGIFYDDPNFLFSDLAPLP